MQKDALINIKLDPFETDEKSTVLLTKLLKAYRFQVSLKADSDYVLAEGEIVRLSYDILNLDTRLAIFQYRFLVLSTSSFGRQEVLGYIRFNETNRCFLGARFPENVGRWQLNKAHNNIENFQQTLAFANKHAAFLQTDLLEVERSRYFLLKKMSKENLADILAREDKGQEVLSLAQRFELCLVLTKMLIDIHSKEDVLSRLTPEDIHVELTKPLSVYITDYSLCTAKRSKQNLGQFQNDKFLAPEYKRSSSLEAMYSMDCYTLGRILWLIWGNNSFIEQCDERIEAFIKLNLLREKEKLKLYELLTKMCSIRAGDRPVFKSEDTSKPYSIKFILSCLASHYVRYDNHSRQRHEVSLDPVSYCKALSSNITAIENKPFQNLVEQTMEAIEDLLGTCRPLLCRLWLSKATNIHQLVDLCMVEGKSQFEATDVLCQFMQIAQRTGYLDYFCEELMIDTICPRLLTLEPNQSYNYIQWRSGIFFDFDNAKQERQKFFDSIQEYLKQKEACLSEVRNIL